MASRSYTNIGKVATTGVDIGLRFFVDRWSLDLSGSWFDYHVEEVPPESPIVPNTPRYKVGLGIGYAAPRFDASLRGHWVDAFTWTSGVFSGPIPSYSRLGR